MGTAYSVLVVDDDVSWRNILGLALRQAGYRVSTAGSAEEALALLQAEVFDCLVTDAKMPSMSGFELAVRAKALRPGLRILMVSALSSKKDAEGFPIDGFLAKPVDCSKLLFWLATSARA